MARRKRIDKLTRQWIRNRGDELAADAGCRFDDERAGHVCQFFEDMLVLYEGEDAGKPFLLMDWQRELLSRVFGWVRYDQDWGREVRRFRVASIWIPKKNGKSPTAAGVGLYLLTRDGEMGQKVFSAAKDGQQAKIVHQHAIEMIRRSKVLSAECTINRSTQRIVHEPTTSFYAILSGDNREGQEGLNGSVVIDETHVVDRRLADVLKYMGASRSEPLRFEVSTAGNDPEGYGKKQYDYGKQVAEGKMRNDQFFWQSYEAPQTASDDECGKVETWAAANPSWCRTIKPSEFAMSYEEAQRSLADFSNFKMYRLNVWQASANPWLKQDDWAKCRSQFVLKDFAGEDCWIGLDLGKTRDMTACVLMFKRDDRVYQWPLFWMPEDEARAKDHLASYLQWARDGHLRLTEGNVCDYDAVRNDILDVIDKHGLRVQLIAFDPWGAEQLTQQLEAELGCEREQVGQNGQTVTVATEDYERAVSGGVLRHPGHPILDWQAGHVQVKESNGRRRPVKPLAKDHRKIDGIAAGVNVITQVLAAEAYDYDGPVFR